MVDILDRDLMMADGSLGSSMGKFGGEEEVEEDELMNRTMQDDEEDDVLDMKSLGSVDQVEDFHSDDVIARRLKERVIALVLGNLFTIGIMGLFYMNYILFESYMEVFLYAFLASEALWDTKKAIVDWIVYINSERVMSPRYMVSSLVMTAKDLFSKYIVLIIPLAAVSMVLIHSNPYGFLVGSGSLTMVLVVLYLVDRHVFVLTRLHRKLLTDDALVAIMLILVLLISGIVCTTLFVFFTANDLKNMLQFISHWIETKLLKSEWAQGLWNELSQHGESTLESWVEDFEQKYVTNTTFEPVFRWGLRYMDQTRNGLTNNTTMFDLNCTNDDGLMSADPTLGAGSNGDLMNGGSDMAWYASWMTIPDWIQNRTMNDWVQMFYEHSQGTDFSSISGKMQGVVMQARNSFWTTAIFALSLLFLVIDFGVRLVFFFTITFILLSSEDNLLHELLIGLFGHHQEDPVPMATSPLQRGLSSSSSSSRSSSPNNRDQQTGGEEHSEYTTNESSYYSTEYGGGAASDVESIQKQLRNIIEAVLMLPVKMSMYHAAATFCLYKLLGIQLVYLASAMSILFTVFPIIYANWVCLPWVIALALNGEMYLAVALLILHYILYYQVDSWALSTFQSKTQKPGAKPSDHSKNEFLTGVSVFFGVTAFGAHGVLIGPLLVCLGLVVYNIFRDQQRNTIQGGKVGTYEVPMSQSNSEANTPSIARSVSQNGSVRRQPHHRRGNSEILKSVRLANNSKSLPFVLQQPPYMKKNDSDDDEEDEDEINHRPRNHSVPQQPILDPEIISEKLKRPRLRQFHSAMPGTGSGGGGGGGTRGGGGSLSARDLLGSSADPKSSSATSLLNHLIGAAVSATGGTTRRPSFGTNDAGSASGRHRRSYNSSTGLSSGKSPRLQAIQDAKAMLEDGTISQHQFDDLLRAFLESCKSELSNK